MDEGTKMPDCIDAIAMQLAHTAKERDTIWEVATLEQIHLMILVIDKIDFVAMMEI